MADGKGIWYSELWEPIEIDLDFPDENTAPPTHRTHYGFWTGFKDPEDDE